ncbi:MAG TPA: glycosyltransferase family 4 protein [Polyangiales bacterium]|nr:glycosyltransferase family 4 protein [Polyangiales bacterium]
MSAHAQDLPTPRTSPSTEARHDPPQFDDTVELDELESEAPSFRATRAGMPRLGIPEGTQFHVLSFEGPDAYSRIGGLETRVAGLCEALVQAGLETHLWFVGQPDLPGYECREGLHLHRWCQWLSQYHPVGVYDGQEGKVPDYAGSLPPVLLRDWLGPHLARGGRAVVMAEEWQTADALLHLDHLLKQLPGRQQARVRMFWNANNVFGFDRVHWERMRSAALVTTVSRYMKQLMQHEGVEAVVLPNGLSPDAYLAPDRAAVNQLRKMFAGRIAITKMARWDPDKNWLGSIDIIAHMKQLGLRPLLIARGGLEDHGLDVLRAMRRAGLRVAERDHAEAGLRGLVQALSDTASVDVLNVTRHVDRDSRRALFRASDVVLANSAKEPFGLVGLEAMAVGGIGCTGLTGEDYVMPGRNALVLQTSDPSEFVKLYMPLRADPEYEAAMRRAGRATARQYAWPEVIRTALAPRLGLSRVD